MELIKCKLQVQNNQNKQIKIKYKNSMDCISKIIQAPTSGYKGLYRGLIATILRDSPAFGVYFVTYEGIKYYFQPKDLKVNEIYYPDTFTLLTAGAAAGITTWLITYPFDVIKSIIQTTSPYKSAPTVRQVFNKYYNLYGYKFFTRGLIATILRSIPVNAVTFVAYEHSLRLLGQVDYC